MIKALLAACIILVAVMPCSGATLDSILQSIPAQQKSAGLE